ncbi:hypothetical protein [Micromonospora sp. NPDC049274]
MSAVDGESVATLAVPLAAEAVRSNAPGTRNMTLWRWLNTLWNTVFSQQV